jgi:c-di-GMP-binding flagellar brake protein YcgR
VKPHSAQPIEIQVLGNGFIEVLKARDISVGGIGVYVPHGFAGCDINSELQILVKIPGTKPFLTQARVRNLGKGSDSAFFGVEFVNLSAWGKERVERYVSQRLAEGGASDFVQQAAAF